MRRTPGKAVVLLPLLLERLAVACPCPELGFFHEDGVYSGINHTLDVPFLDVVEIILCGHDIRHHRPMPDSIAVLLHLSFIEMGLAVPFACEVVLVFTPSNACHEMGDVAAFLPRTDSVLDGTPGRCAGISTHTIYHHGIGSVVYSGPPCTSGLEGGLHTVICINGLARRGIASEKAHGQRQREKSVFHLNRIYRIMFILDSRHKFKGFLPKMENFPIKIVRQPLPRTFCGEKMPGRPCRGLFGVKK